MAGHRSPADHPLRESLGAELHARPPAQVPTPAVASFLALTGAAVDAFGLVLQVLIEAGPDAARAASHGIGRFGEMVVKWELHGEFASLVFVRPLVDGEGRAATAAFPTALSSLPPGWLDTLPGQTIAAGDVLVVPEDDAQAEANWLAACFDPDATSGSDVSGRSGRLYTDFRTPHGRSRWLLFERGMGRLQTARTVQRVIEIDVYRMMALLGFPVARAAFTHLSRLESELERIASTTAALDAGNETQEQERALLQELSKVAAEVERLHAEHAFRFGASQAYWTIVRARIDELREERVAQLRTLGGFLSRRLAPAMESCAAAARRLEHLSERIERASGLLRTRVDVAREEQNLRLLAAMERRGKLQLRLQETVEGLSVVAISYYAAGLLSYVLKPFDARVPSATIVAVAIPILAVAGLLGLRRRRRRLEAE